MQYKVPQNIDLEDKIIGPLTMLQFIYLMAGGMIVYTAFELFQTGLFFLIALPVSLLSLGLAFLKIQDQPFSKFLVALIFYLVRPKARIWDKLPEREKFKSELVDHAPKKVGETNKVTKTIERSELEKLAMLLDTSSPNGKAKGTANSSQADLKDPDLVDIFVTKTNLAKGVNNGQKS